MTWAKFDDCAPDHPKVSRLSDAAHRLWFNAVCYGARMLTNGNVPASMVPRLTTSKPAPLVAELVNAGLWHPADDGYDIHDFLVYQPTRANVLAKRASDSARKRGGTQPDSQRPVPTRPYPLKTSTSTARDVFGEMYWRHFGHDPTDGIRSELENMIAVHPEECVAWVLSEVGGMAPDKRNWRYARFKFNDCAKDGHGGPNGRANNAGANSRTNGVRPYRGGGGGAQSGKPSSGPDLAGWEQARSGR